MIRTILFECCRQSDTSWRHLERVEVGARDALDRVAVEPGAQHAHLLERVARLTKHENDDQGGSSGRGCVYMSVWGVVVRRRIGRRRHAKMRFHYIAVHRSASQCIASHRIASHRIASHRIASHRIALHGILLHCITWHSITSHYNLARQVLVEGEDEVDEPLLDLRLEPNKHHVYDI